MRQTIPTKLIAILLMAVPLCLAAGEDRVGEARAAARRHIESRASAYGVAASDLHEYDAFDEPEYGVVHLKYAQVYRDLPVLWAQLFLHVRDGRVSSEQNKLRGNVHLDSIEPRLTSEDAAQIAVADQHLVGSYEVTDAALAVLPRTSLEGKPEVDRLVWRMTIYAANELDPLTSFEAIVDAEDGSIWTAYSLLRE